MQDGRSPYFGATVGRVANRIAGAKFVLKGVQYNLSANDPPNSLHGGKFGWSRKPWTLSSREVFDDGGSAVKLKYTSVDGEEVRPHCPCCITGHMCGTNLSCHYSQLVKGMYEWKLPSSMGLPAFCPLNEPPATLHRSKF